MLSHSDQVWWGWLDARQKITVKRFVSKEEIAFKERDITTKGIFDPFAASCVEEAMEICLNRYRLQLEDDAKQKEIITQC